MNSALVNENNVSAALDRLAAEIDARGADGVRLLPLYRRLEGEITRMALDADAMASVRLRLRQSKGGKAERYATGRAARA